MFPSRSPYLRLSLLLGLFLPAFAGGLFLAFSSSPDTPATAPPPLVTSEIDMPDTEGSTVDIMGRDVFKVVEQMPLFPGSNCGDKSKYKKRKNCADRAMLEYIYDNVRYPKRARDRNISGVAVVSFIVEPHGAITNVEIVRDPGGGLGEAAAKTVRKMRKDNLRWEPGLHKGKPVAVRFNLPVKFKLE
jgi:TonB family protein